MLNADYSINSISASPAKRDSHSWGLKGYRPDTSVITQRLRSLQSAPFIQGNTVRAEVNWLALYCTDEDYTIQYLMRVTGLRRKELGGFCAYYSVDLKKRNVIGGAK